MANFRFKKIVAFVATFLVLFSSVNLAFAPRVYAVPDDVKTKDANRRKLHASLRCLDNAILDGDDEISDFNDMFDNRRWAGKDQYGWEAEIAIYGLDLTSNGVVTCKTALSDALSILGEQSDDLGILKALTNNKHSDFSVGIPGVDLDPTNLKNRITAKEDALRTQLLETPYYDYLLRLRLKELIGICYTVDGPPISRSNLGSRDFTHEINGKTVNFYYNGDQNIRKVIDSDNGGWYDDDGNGGRPSHIGDIQLGVSASNVHPDVDGFYPMGDDRDILNDKAWGSNSESFFGLQTTMGLQACNLIKEKASWIFEKDWQVGDTDINTVDPVTKKDDGGTNDGKTGPGGATDEVDGCEASGFSLSWLVCPIVNGITDGMEKLFTTVIIPLLKTKTISRQIDGENTPIFSVWVNFRNLANILLIIILLVAVLAQAVGGSFIDAYTLKKIIPRVVIGVILLNLSFYLIAFLYDLVNILGDGIGNIIYAPFKTAGALGFQPGEWASLGTLAAGIGAAVTAIVIGGPLFSMLAVFVLLPFMFAVLGTLMTLFLRQALLVFLVIISPVAIVLYCLPSTEQYLKKWWSILIKTLLVYPIVVILFTLANIAPSILEITDKNSVVYSFMQIIAMFIPIFIIPFAFKLSGGMVGSLYGALSGLGKRATKAIQGDERDPNSLSARTKRGFRIRRAETGTTGAALGARVNPRTAFNRSARRGQLTSLKASQLMALGGGVASTDMWKAHQEDDKVMGALANYKDYSSYMAGVDEWERSQRLAGVDEASIAAGRQQKVTAGEAARSIGWSQTSRRAAMMTSANIGYALGAGEQGWNQAMKSMREISGGDETEFRSMVNQFQAVAKSAGRADLSGNTDSDEYNGYRAWNSVGLYQQGNGKPKSIEGSGDYFTGLLERSQNPATLTNTDIENFGFGRLTKEEQTAFRDGTMDPDLQAVVRAEAADKAQQAAAVFALECGTLQSQATGGVRDEAAKQSSRIQGILSGIGRGGLTSDPTVTRLARGVDRTDRGAGPGAPAPTP